MRKNLLHCVMAAALLSATACQTTRPPHVPQPPSEAFLKDPAARKAAETRAAVGMITVSTPLAKALISEPADNDRLDFGATKSEDNLRTAIRSANMSRSLMQYEAVKAALAVNVAGTQVSSSNTTETSGGLSGSLDPIKLITSLLAVSSGTPAAAATPADIANLKADFSAKASASHTESFKSPEVPGAPTAPSMPDPVRDKLLTLLSPATGTVRLDPSQEARLIASYKTYMTALEDFYNADNVANYIDKLESKDWHPYRIVFSVSVDPGWYPLLKQQDAVVDLNFPSLSGGQEMRVINVMPAEAAQTVDELTASLSEVASALTLAGGFETVAVNSKLEYLNALAQRLEGARKQTNLIVSYPAQNIVRIRVRPSVVASSNLAETQPTNIVFAGTVLVSNATKEKKPVDTSAIQGELSALTRELLEATRTTRALNKPLDNVVTQIQSIVEGRSATSQIIDQLRCLTDRLETASANDPKILSVSNRLKEFVRATDTTRPFSTMEAKNHRIYYTSHFEPQTMIQRKVGIIAQAASYPFGPSEGQRDILPAMFAEDGTVKQRVELGIFIPNWPEEISKFGFAKDPAGFYDSDGKTATGFISYSIRNPKEEDAVAANMVCLYADDEKQPRNLGNSESLQGVLKVEGIKFDGSYGDPIRVFLKATDSAGKTEVRVATLLPRVQSEPGSPMVSIDAGGVKAENVPLDPTTTELVKALKPQQEKTCCKKECCK